MNKGYDAGRPSCGKNVPFAPAVRHVARLTALLLMIVFPAVEVSAQSPGLTRSDVQAVYLYNFAKFVRWPAESQHDALTICVAGQRVYIDTLSKIVAGERIDTRPLGVRAVQRPEDVAGCDIVFVDDSARERLDPLLAATAGKPILTVSDIPGFIGRGGMIEFLVVNRRVRFSVNLGPVEHSDISLSSELLKIAVNVNGREGAP